MRGLCEHAIWVGNVFYKCSQPVTVKRAVRYRVKDDNGSRTYTIWNRVCDKHVRCTCDCCNMPTNPYIEPAQRAFTLE